MKRFWTLVYLCAAVAGFVLGVAFQTIMETMTR